MGLKGQKPSWTFIFGIAIQLFFASVLATNEVAFRKDGMDPNYASLLKKCKKIKLPNGTMIQTVPKLLQTPLLTGCSAWKSKYGSPLTQAVCRFPDCLSNPCQNGWCEETLRGYQCLCFPGFRGKHCAETSTAPTDTTTITPSESTLSGTSATSTSGSPKTTASTAPTDATTITPSDSTMQETSPTSTSSSTTTTASSALTDATSMTPSDSTLPATSPTSTSDPPTTTASTAPTDATTITSSESTLSGTSATSTSGSPMTTASTAPTVTDATTITPSDSTMQETSPTSTSSSTTTTASSASTDATTMTPSDSTLPATTPTSTSDPPTTTGSTAPTDTRTITPSDSTLPATSATSTSSSSTNTASSAPTDATTITPSNSALPVSSSASTSRPPTTTGSSARVFVTDIVADAIFVSEMGDTLNFTSIPSTKSPNYVTYDPTERHIYWSDLAARCVYRANLDGTDREQITVKGADRPHGIAIAKRSRMLYIAYWDTHKVTSMSIERGSPLPGTDTDFVSHGIDDPRALVIDEEEGFLYISRDYGTRALLNATNDIEEIYHNTDLWSLTGLSIDLTRNPRRIFFSDVGKNRTFYKDVNPTPSSNTSSAVELTAFLSYQGSLMGVSFFSGNLYWLTRDPEGIGIMTNYDQTNPSYRLQKIRQFKKPRGFFITFIEP